MTRLTDAIALADARKVAALGKSEVTELRAGTVDQSRSIFVGLDLDYAELEQTVRNLADNFVMWASEEGLRDLFISAWIDGLVVGTMLAKVPDVNVES